MVRFDALKSAIVRDSKAPKPQNEALNEALEDALEKKILLILKNNPQITQKEIVQYVGVSRATLQRIMKNMTEQGKIKRVGGKRYGHWEIHE